MCTVVLLRRPGARRPLILGGNRDERMDRPTRPPGRWWPDRPWAFGGYDETAGGTWLALREDGFVATVLNREGSLGPAPGKRSRGELPLMALDHGSAAAAADSMSMLNADAYRPFNLILADADSAWWLRASGGAIRLEPIAEGVSMIAAGDLNDPESERLRTHLPIFRAAAAPDPDAGDWRAWETALDGGGLDEAGRGALRLRGPSAFRTVSSHLVAAPARGGEETALFRWRDAIGADRWIDCARSAEISAGAAAAG